MTKRSLMLTASAAAAVGFAVPWVAIRSLPASVLPVDRQVIVVPSSDRFVVSSGTTASGAGVAGAAITSAPAVATTRASAPAPPGA
jgi:hypothetical protein